MTIWPWSTIRTLDRALTNVVRERDVLQRRVEWYGNENRRQGAEYAKELNALRNEKDAAARKASELQAMLAEEQVAKGELLRRIQVLEQRYENKGD